MSQRARGAINESKVVICVSTPQVNQRMTKKSAASDAKATCDDITGYRGLRTTRGAARKLVARVTPRHIVRVAGAQGSRQRPLRPPSG